MEVNQIGSPFCHVSPRVPFLDHCFSCCTLITSRKTRDILNVYSDRTGKKIDHYFFNTILNNEFSCGKEQIP